MRINKFPFGDVKLDMSFVRTYFNEANPLLPAMVKKLPGQRHKDHS